MASILSYALTTLSDVKESLGIASNDTTKDNLITRKINQATRAIEAYCGRRFKETTYTNELYFGTNTNQIVLRNRPITSTQTFGIQVRDTPLNQNTFETVDTNLYFTDANSGVVDLEFRALGQAGSYQITYSAGYATIPEDLAEACASLACFYVQNANSSQIGAKKKQEGQRTLEYNNNNNLLSFDNIMAQLGIDGIINSYANYPVMTDR